MLHPMTRVDDESDDLAVWHEYVCEACGRRQLVRFRPWSQIILEPGDTGVQHSQVLADEGYGLRFSAAFTVQEGA